MKIRLTLGRLILGGALILASAIQTFAIEGLQLSVQCSNVVLSWPSIPGQNYIVEYRPNLYPSTPWLTLTSSLPADWTSNVTYFVHSNIVKYPNCGSVTGPSSAMSASGQSASSETFSEPMAMRNDSSDFVVPIAIFPPGFVFDNYLLYDPATGEWTSGVGVVRPWPEPTFAASGAESDGPTPEDDGGSGGLDMGFYHVVQDGVKLLDSTITNLTNGVLSGTVNVRFEAGNASFDGTGTNLQGIIACANLNIDGAKFIGDGVVDPPWESSYPWQIAMDTAYLENGDHWIQVEVSWKNPDSTDSTTLFSRWSDPIMITVSNFIYYPQWEPEIGEMDISAYFLKTVCTNGDWQIDIYDVSNRFVQSLTGHTTDGTIEAYWNMVDTNGVARTNAVFDPEFNSIVTVSDPGTATAPKKKQRPKSWPDHGKWTVAYEDFFKFDYSANNRMQGSINTYANTAAQYGGYYLYYPQPGQTNDTGQTYPMRYQNTNHIDTNITAAALQKDRDLLLSYLSNTNSRNFFYDGHGWPHGISSSLNGISTADLQKVIKHRYRFVMLDVCSGANGDLDRAFGITGPGRFAISYYHSTGLRPGAFCGYNQVVFYAPYGQVTRNGVTYDHEIPDDVPFFVTNFLFYWSSLNRALNNAIENAAINLPTPGGYRGRENHWKIYGYDELHIDEVNHASDTW